MPCEIAQVTGSEDDDGDNGGNGGGTGDVEFSDYNVSVDGQDVDIDYTIVNNAGQAYSIEVDVNIGNENLATDGYVLTDGESRSESHSTTFDLDPGESFTGMVCAEFSSLSPITGL